MRTLALRGASGAGRLVALLIFLVPAGSDATDDDIQLWSVARVNHALDEKWSISFQSRARFDEDVSNEKDVMLRPYLSWTIVEGVPLVDSLTVIAGYDYLRAFDGRDEHRAWQSAHHAVENGRFRLVHRVRLDQRFIEDVDPTVYRLRYRLRASRPFPDRRWYGLASNEVFVNLNDGNEGPHDGFEANRFRLGLGRHLGGRLRAESGYELQFARRRSDPSVFRHVVFLELSLATGNRGGSEFIAAPEAEEASTGSGR